MFTKNWYKAIASQMAYTTNIKKSVNYAGTTGVQSGYSTTGVFLSILNTGNTDNYPSMHKLRTSTTGAGGVILGTGTTPPTIDDYKLSGNIITGYAYNASVKYTSDDECTAYTAVYTITNNKTSDITIGEIGLLCTTNVSASGAILLERTVLDNPVTIPAGGVGQITYTIRFDYPTA